MKQENKKIILECKSLCKTYSEGPQAVNVLDQLELQLQQGERLAIIGASGSGKSTLLNLLGGLDTPTSGEVSINGKLLSTASDDERGHLRNHHLGFVYQFHHLLGEFSAQENVAMPLLIRGENKNEALQKATGILAQLGLDKRIDHKPAELSGGERQRVAIARAIVGKPDCVLMDEPTGNLDENTAESIENLLSTLNQQFQLSFIMVTHDKRLAMSMDRVLELKQGKLYEVAQ